jgi:hypothetical protein
VKLQVPIFYIAVKVSMRLAMQFSSPLTITLEDGLDFTDALHDANYQDCEAMASFDDRKFARKVKRLGLAPRVIIPT